MFYDAHYLFPRPWTQAQEVPGVPDPFPAAFYGSNTLSQTFVSGANNLSMVEVWLQGSPYGWVEVTLSDEAGPLYRGQVEFPENPRGGKVRFSFPTISDAKGRPFTITLAAPASSATQPTITHIIGGDRLGGPLRLNEYRRPGNLALHTYVTGTAVPDALAEQLLPNLFRQRLQQFKPAIFKGEWFAGLFLLLVGLTVLFLVLTWPSNKKVGQSGGWFLVCLLLGMLVWQIGTRRVQLSGWGETRLQASTAVAQPTVHDELRLVNDLTAILWTAERLPEKRFVSTEIADYPAVRVPAESALEYALDLPLNGRLQTGLQAVGEGSLLMAVTFNGERVAETAVAAGDQPQWLNLDLTPWQGQGGILRLVTKPVEGMPDGLWLMPQLLARRDWLLDDLPETAVPAGHRFAEDVMLVGYTVDPTRPQPGELVTVTLYWRGERPLSHNATVFVHALTAGGDLMAQSDRQPVQNSYPLVSWLPGVLVADTHQFIWPTDDALVQLAVGLYTPTTLVRLPVTNPNGMPSPNDQAQLPVQSLP